MSAQEILDGLMRKSLADGELGLKKRKEARGGRRVPTEGSDTGRLCAAMLEIWGRTKQPVCTPRISRGQTISFCQGINSILKQREEETGEDLGITAKTREGKGDNDWWVELSPRLIKREKEPDPRIMAILADLESQIPKRDPFKFNLEDL